MGSIILVVGSIVAAAIVFALAILLMPASTSIGSGTETNKAPEMQLLLLEGTSDYGKAIAAFEAGDDGLIRLHGSSHIRFDSPDYREPDSIHVLAVNLETGKTEILRKSYNVNNEFFVLLPDGAYRLQVLAKWSDRGSFQYNFNINVV